MTGVSIRRLSCISLKHCFNRESANRHLEGIAVKDLCSVAGLLEVYDPKVEVAQNCKLNVLFHPTDFDEDMPSVRSSCVHVVRFCVCVRGGSSLEWQVRVCKYVGVCVCDFTSLSLSLYLLAMVCASGQQKLYRSICAASRILTIVTTDIED